MHPTHRQLSLEQFQARSSDGRLVVRLASVMILAAVLSWCGTLGWPAAVGWVASFCLAEAAIAAWWRHVQPRLSGYSRRALRKCQSVMILFYSANVWIISLPFLLGSPPTPTAVMVGVLFPAGVVMVIAAQHSLSRTMYLYTAPPAAAALILNAWRMGEGTDAWLLAGLAVLLVINARSLALSNANSYAGLISAKIEAEKANDAKSTFLATISHEIRTPLNGVLGMAQAMELGELNADQRERLGVVQRSGEALMAVLNDVLDMSKIEAGKIELETTEFCITECVAAASDAFHAIADAKGLTFTLDIEPAAGLYQGDPARLRQIIYNLVSNALKFTHEGGIAVTARRDGALVVLTVRDTGIGMDEGAVRGLFSRFSQADAATTRRYGGTGLGLSISRELVEMMGGDIRVDSRPGRGSLFTVRLPLPYLGAAPEPGPAPEEPATTVASEAPLRILVAEDNLTNQLVLQSLLHSVAPDLELRMVANGRQALHAWELSDFDIILMDVNMPVMDGLAATRAIRAEELKLARRRTPIIALTANAMSHQVAEHLAAGMDAHVAKPIDLTVLLETLNAVLEDTPQDEAA